MNPESIADVIIPSEWKNTDFLKSINILDQKKKKVIKRGYSEIITGLNQSIS